MTISLLVSLIVVAVSKNSDDDNVVSTTPKPEDILQEVCLTKACIDTSSKILAQIDESVNPCDDFYEFSCGSYLKETLIPDDKASITPFNIVEDDLRIDLLRIVEEPIEGDEIEPFQNVKKLYKSCMNIAQIENQGLKPILDVLSEVGGWPVLLDVGWDTDNSWILQNFIVESKSRGFSPEAFFSFKVDTDFKESSKRTIEVSKFISYLFNLKTYFQTDRPAKFGTSKRVFDQ